jgi:PAP2 superfamily C-terminal
MSPPLWALRAVVVAAGLGGWFWTQALIAKRAFPEGRIGDGLHELTAPLNRWLLASPRWADRLLIATSGLIDVLGIFLVIVAIFGPSLRPVLGLLILYALRQICQGLCALPPPEGMIWRYPGFPSLLVTYGTATDLFFSGHTAIAVYGAIELGHVGGPWWGLVGAIVAVVEASTVLILRAHYTMDVFAAVVTAFWAASLAEPLALVADRVVTHLLTQSFGS